MIDSQRPGFEELYQAFLGFFADSIRKDDSPWNKIRLQMMSQYFDELALYKIITPIIQRIQSNPEDRRAIARAALWDALVAHQMGQMFATGRQALVNEKPLDITPFDHRRTFTVEHDVPVTTGGETVTEIRVAKSKFKRKTA